MATVINIFYSCGFVFLFEVLIVLGSTSKLQFKIKEGSGSKQTIAIIAQELALVTSGGDQGYKFRLSSPSRSISDLFRINEATSELSTISEIDRDTICQRHQLCCEPEATRTTEPCIINFRVMYTISSSEVGSLNQMRFCVVEVHIQDINDCSPTFSVSHFPLDIPESAQVGADFPLPRASDADGGTNGIQTYRIKGGNGLFTTRINRLGAGEIMPSLELNERLDREVKSQYQLTLLAIDGGTPPLTGSIQLTVHVIDDNDNSPQVDPSISFPVKEDTPVGSSIGRIKATDLDSGENSQLSYHLRSTASGKVIRLFKIDSKTGEIRLTNRLDYDIGPKSYILPVIVSDNGKPKRSASTSVTIRLTDVNDEAPEIVITDLYNRFPPRPEVYENMNADAFVAFVKVTDLDTGPSGTVTCQIENSAFRLIVVDQNLAERSVEYKLVTTGRLDREVRSIERVAIICSDQGVPSKINEVIIDVVVLDRNDNPPRFASTFLNASVLENMRAGTYVTTLNASDADQKNPGDGITYSLDKEGLRFFRIDSRSGRLYTLIPFDRESLDRVQFRVTASDSGVPPVNTTARVTVHILDENDCVPEFQYEYFTFSVAEEIAPGHLVGVLGAKDRDAGINKEFTMVIDDIRGTAQNTFTLDSRTGKLFTKRQLDREIRSEYDFGVTIRDKGYPPQSSRATVKVIVTDANDNKPKFIYPTQQNHTVYCSVYNLQGTPIVKLTAVDSDTGENAELLFLITSGNQNGIFELDPKTGDVTLTRDLTEDDVGEYRLTLEVRDNGSPCQVAVSSIAVVLDTTSPRQRPPGYGLLGPRDRRPGGYFHDLSSDRNLVLVVCLVVIATVLAVIFLFIVVWLKRKPQSSSQGGRRRRRDREGGDNTCSRTGSNRRLMVTAGTLPSDHHLISKRDLMLTGEDSVCLTSTLPLKTMMDGQGKSGCFDGVKFVHPSRLNLHDESGLCGGDEASDLSMGCRISEDSGITGGSHDQLNAGHGSTFRSASSACPGRDSNSSNYYQQLSCNECPGSVYGTARSYRQGTPTGRGTLTSEKNFVCSSASANPNVSYQTLQQGVNSYATLKLVHGPPNESQGHDPASQHSHQNLLQLSASRSMESGTGFRLKPIISNTVTLSSVHFSTPVTSNSTPTSQCSVNNNNASCGPRPDTVCSQGFSQCSEGDDCGGDAVCKLNKSSDTLSRKPFTSTYASSFV